MMSNLLEHLEILEDWANERHDFKEVCKHSIPIQDALQRLESIDNAIAICQKANEQKFVYIKEKYGIFKGEFFDNLDYEVLKNRLYVNSRGIYYDLPLKDYGVWWALTKEELENE